VPLHYVARPSKNSAAAFIAALFSRRRRRRRKTNIRLSRISRLAAEIFGQPADSRKKFDLGLY